MVLAVHPFRKNLVLVEISQCGVADIVTIFLYDEAIDEVMFRVIVSVGILLPKICNLCFLSFLIGVLMCDDRVQRTEIVLIAIVLCIDGEDNGNQ